MTASRDEWKRYRGELLAMIELEQQFIDNAEAGRTEMWEVTPDNAKINTTAGHIKRSKSSIQVMRGVISEIERNHLA